MSMSLKQYMKALPDKPSREAFAARVGTSLGHLANIAGGHSSCRPALAVSIARDTAGAVTRQVLRPNDYWRLWPDLPRPPEQPKSDGVGVQ